LPGQDDFDATEFVWRNDVDDFAATDVAKIVELPHFKSVSAGTKRDADEFPRFELLVRERGALADAGGGDFEAVDGEFEFRAELAFHAHGGLRHGQGVAV